MSAMLHLLQPDPGPPKRGLNAFMFFCQDWRDRVKAENPGAPFGLLGKILGAKWKQMNETEQESYHEMARNDRIRYEIEKKAWDDAGVARKVAAPVSDDEDDED